MGSAAASSSSSNSLNDAQKDSGDRGLPARSFNQSTSTFSGETNPPSATYADSALSTSPTTSPLPTSSSSLTPAHSAASAVDGDSCDSMETQIIEDKSSRGDDGNRNINSSGVMKTRLLRYKSYYSSGPASNRFWGIPQGLGLRGGAGETSLNNGAGTWGHPPASGGWGGGGGGGAGGNGGGSASGAGGTNSATNPVQSQWGAGSSSAANVQRSSAASQGPPGAPPPGSSGSQPVSGNSQQLPTGGQQQQAPQSAWDQPKTVAQPSGSSPNQGVWAAQVRHFLFFLSLFNLRRSSDLKMSFSFYLFRLPKTYLINRPILIKT